jgi:hypothetical protein
MTSGSRSYAICLAERRHLPLIRGFLKRLLPEVGDTFKTPYLCRKLQQKQSALRRF